MDNSLEDQYGSFRISTMNMPDQLGDECYINFILLFKSKNFVSKLIVTTMIAIIPIVEILHEKTRLKGL